MTNHCNWWKVCLVYHTNRNEENPSMKKIVLTFGLISGVISSVMMLATVPFMETIGFDRGLIVGYTSIVLSFLLVYFGIRSYRDNVAGGSVSFGRAFSVGLLITLMSCVFYVATWQVIYNTMMPDFYEKYERQSVKEARASGATEAEIQAKQKEVQRYRELAKNPLINAAMTFVEPFPVGLIITLVSAGVLSRKRREQLSPGLA